MKKLRFSRVVSLQGARQTGKSFLARHLLRADLPHARYVSLDSKADRDQAEHLPDTFLQRYEEAKPLIIDEAQKAPNIFDAIKLKVDESPRPGQFILLGSTEFAREVMVRESLTGRLGRVRIFPMNFRELSGPTSRLPSSGLGRRRFLEQLDRGGMPGIAFVRDSAERRALIDEWLRLICERDLGQFKKLKLDGEVAREIFQFMNQLEEPTAAALARATKINARRIGVHLKALEHLFSVYHLRMHPAAQGTKPIFVTLDAGIAGYLGASLRRKILISLLNERLCFHHYAGRSGVKFYYFRSRTKNHIDLIEESELGTHAFQIFETESWQGTDLELMKAFLKKVPQANATILAPVREDSKISGITLSPWEKLTLGGKLL